MQAPLPPCGELSIQEFWKEFSRFESSQDLLCKEKISLYSSIGSTNTELLSRLNERVYAKGASLLAKGGTDFTAEGKQFHKTLAASAEQTAGRGRMGRTFYSPAKSGIYFSFAYVQRGGVTNPSMYTITSAVGVCRAIKRVFGIEAAIKWVNDVYVGSKKVCGILTEGISNPGSGTVECAVVGIGINISSSENLPGELRDKAGDILSGIPKEKGGAFASREKLLAACMYEILKSLDSGEDILTEYKSRSMLTGRTVTVHPTIGNEQSSYRAKVLGITDSAALLVQKENGSLCTLSTGEVSLTVN